MSHGVVQLVVTTVRFGICYDDWWKALGWVREVLIADTMLRELEVTMAMPKVRPWEGSR